MNKDIFQTGMPMRMHISCVNILTIENYLKSVLPEVPYDQIFDGIAGNENFLINEESTGKLIPVTQDYLLNPNNWASNELFAKLFSNTVEILDDKKAIYKAGKNIFSSTVGSRLVLMRLVGVQTIIKRIPKENAKFNRNKDIQVVENKKGFAIVRLHWYKDPKMSKHFCDMFKGVCEGLGTFTKNPAMVEEKTCYFEGGDYCEMHITWKAKNLFSRFFDFVRYWSYHSIIDDLEAKIEEIDDLRVKQGEVIELRTQQLKETQAKLNEAEKRSLEHRITGGFAHEMRNALAGAQLEFQTVINYKEQGFSATEAIKQSTYNLLKIIQAFHKKYQIPCEETVTEAVPYVKEISAALLELSKTMEGVNQDIERGLAITNQIREYAKMSEMKRGNAEVDLMTLFRGYGVRYRSNFESDHISYSVSGPESLIIQADETHMNSIFSNLIKNAMDSLRQKQGRNKQINVNAKLSSHEEGKKITVTVQDNGQGIPEALLGEIFEPFFSTKPSSGTGLGLGIVKRLVNLYGGKIAVESKENEWTTFTLVLPAKMH